MGGVGDIFIVFLFISFPLTPFPPTHSLTLSVVSFVYARRPRCSGRLVLFFQAFITRERKEEAVTKEKEREDRSCDCSFLPFRLLQSIVFFTRCYKYCTPTKNERVKRREKPTWGVRLRDDERAENCLVYFLLTSLWAITHTHTNTRTVLKSRRKI